MKALSAALIVLGLFGLIAYSEYLFASMAPLWGLLALLPVMVIVGIIHGDKPKPKES